MSCCQPAAKCWHIRTRMFFLHAAAAALSLSSLLVCRCLGSWDNSASLLEARSGKLLRKIEGAASRSLRSSRPRRRLRRRIREKTFARTAEPAAAAIVCVCVCVCVCALNVKGVVLLLYGVLAHYYNSVRADSASKNNTSSTRSSLILSICVCTHELFKISHRQYSDYMLEQVANVS